MNKLPDGSAFFTAVIYSERPAGLVNKLKYTKHATARNWLLLWRNYRSALILSRMPDQGPPMSHLKALRWSWGVLP